jgi:cell wall-associated NlpC family hydrolase
MKKKLVKYSLSVAILATMIQATPAFASPVNTSITKGQINTTQVQINNLDTQIQQLDNQVSVAMDKSQKLNDEIKAQQDKIQETKAEIQKAQQDLDAHKKVFFGRVRSLEEQEQPVMLTYAEILLGSQSLSDFFSRTTAISIILQSDNDIMNGLKDKQLVLTNAQTQLANELSDLKNKQDELASQQKQIEADKQQVLKQLADSKNNLKKQQTKLAQQQAQIAQQQALQQAQLLAQQEAQQEAQQASLALKSQQAQSSLMDVSTLSYSSDKAKTVIATAEKYLGVPYVWGGTTPNGFDCSGLMQYVFHSVGVDLPRVAQDQQNVGTMISPTQVQAGDLVFMGYPAYHVGMYIGNGKWLEAPQTGDVVKIANYNPAIFSSASRILN